MDDATPSATPMPVPPMTTVTGTEAFFPPAAAPLPVFVPPSVTDPVSNLDFLPVDDAFALEMRSETIEQLVGGDALRRGVSERIEAGRSHTNADLVAGRDRVRVQGSLHEHTGHGLAEQAEHLHITADGRLDVHAGCEDTVLLAGHMSDLWDGGTAIVAAMTDDTAAGGGIRVTTPLDLWVHGLMGVEERIGTCTADAVLMESSATHYEREYGPGVHAAGLAVYTGSLYQSSRSTFRPLMRVSSGVRNLIAADGGGGAGSDGGAGDAPGASPPPVPAQTGAATESATGTLAAGRRTAETPAPALDTANALTDAPRVSLDALVDSVDARGGEDMAEARAVMRAENLPELTRSTDTAEQLRALQETLRIDGAEAGSDTASAFRASEFEGAVSTHLASRGGGPLEITPPSTVAPTVRPHPGAPRGQGPEMRFTLLGGADRPPQSAAPKSDFPSVDRRMSEIRIRYTRLSRMTPVLCFDLQNASLRVYRRIMSEFENFGGRVANLGRRTFGVATSEKAYLALQDMAAQADRDYSPVLAGAIRDALDAIDKEAVAELQALCTKHRIADAPSTLAMQRPPATVPPTVAATVLPPGTFTPPVTGGATRVPVGSLDQGSIGHLTRGTGGPGLPPASGLPGPSLAEAAGAEASDLGRGRLDPPATASRTRAAHRALTATTINPVLAGAFSFWPQPVDPVATVSGTTAAHRALTGAIAEPLRAETFLAWLQVEPVPVRGVDLAPFDSGLHRAGETARPPPVTTTARRTESAPDSPYPASAWRNDNFAIESALLAGELPPGFNASRLIAKAREYPQFGLAEQLIAGHLPIRTIEDLIDGYRAAGEGGSHTVYIEYLHSLKESIDRALRDAYPGRIGPHWIEQMRSLNLALRRGERAAPSAPSAPGRTGAGSGAPPPTADAWRNRPPGTSGAPPRAGFGRWSAPPGPGRRGVSTGTMRTPAMAAGAPPGWQSDATPGFGRAASGAVELPFWHRREIARWFSADDAVIQAEFALRSGAVFGWPIARRERVLDDLYRLKLLATRMNPDAPAAMVDLDWSAIDALMRIFDVHHRSP